MTVVALDIETTDLSPWDGRITTAAVACDEPIWGSREHAFDGEETSVLWQLQRFMEYVPRVHSTLVTWNGSEFDFPYIAVRTLLTHDYHHGPYITRRQDTGKYGKPRYNTEWRNIRDHDVAYDYQELAEKMGVSWSLKPMARVLGYDAIEVDFKTRTMEDLTPTERMEYCLSDAKLVLALHLDRERHLGKRDRPRGRSVSLEGGFTIL